MFTRSLASLSMKIGGNLPQSDEDNVSKKSDWKWQWKCVLQQVRHWGWHYRLARTVICFVMFCHVFALWCFATFLLCDIFPSFCFVTLFLCYVVFMVFFKLFQIVFAYWPPALWHILPNLHYVVPPHFGIVTSPHRQAIQVSTANVLLHQITAIVV